MTDHTPGPWVARDETNRGAIYSASAYPGRPIATTSSYWTGDGPRDGERQANADLIAAAPELLKALQDALDAANEMELSSAHFPREAISAAISKAKPKEKDNG